MSSDSQSFAFDCVHCTCRGVCTTLTEVSGRLRLRSAQRGASHNDQIWYTHFPSCCAANMELFTATSTSPFTNHQPRSVPDWTQIPPVQVRLHMTLPPRTIEEWTNLLIYLLLSLWAKLSAVVMCRIPVVWCPVVLAQTCPSLCSSCQLQSVHTQRYRHCTLQWRVAASQCQCLHRHASDWRNERRLATATTLATACMHHHHHHHHQQQQQC